MKSSGPANCLPWSCPLENRSHEADPAPRSRAHQQRREASLGCGESLERASQPGLQVVPLLAVGLAQSRVVAKAREAAGPWALSEP